MRYFDSGNSLSQDECNLELKCIENTDIYKYNVNNLASDTNRCQNDFFYKNLNLQCTHGYGNTSKDTVDIDSKLRYKDPTNMRPPDKQQLHTRLFTAVPDLSSGTFIPDVESRYFHGHNTENDRCRSLTEIFYDRNKLFTPCIDAYVHGYSKAVGNENRIGIPSRELKQCCSQVCQPVSIFPSPSSH